jgi:hypothetical protein
MNSLPNLIIRLSQEPFNSDLNYDVAEEYLRLNQTASAVSFYLRCVEYGPKENDLQVYASLLRMSQCFGDQQGREYSVTNCLLQAITYDDTRPEAYLLLSQFHEKAQQWQESYTWASMGAGWFWQDKPLLADVGYYGGYCLQFQLAVAAWWIGRKNEALEILNALANRDDLHPTYENAVTYNLEKLNALL